MGNIGKLPGMIREHYDRYGRRETVKWVSRGLTGKAYQRKWLRGVLSGGKPGETAEAGKTLPVTGVPHDWIAWLDGGCAAVPAAAEALRKAMADTDAELIYTDGCGFRETPGDTFAPDFKPDYAPDTLRTHNYMGGLMACRMDLWNRAGLTENPAEGAYDRILRLTEQAKGILHLPEVLYFRKEGVTESAESERRALENHLKRTGLKGEVTDTGTPNLHRVRYDIEGDPLVSILIPNKDHREDMKKCLDSVYEKTTGVRFEVIVIENNSTDPETFRYYEELERTRENLRVVAWEGGFNFSAINNLGAGFARGEHLLLLNNDTEVRNPDWLREMLSFSQRKDVGAVGAKLYYPDHTIQHAGIGIGLMWLAAHYHRYFDGDAAGYRNRLLCAQDLSAVTAACCLIRREVWDEVRGLDETLEVAFNDVDLCMRIRKAGYLIVWTPHAELTHYESKSRGTEDDPVKKARFQGEVERFQKRWAAEMAAGDPYYNPNLTLSCEDFSLK